MIRAVISLGTNSTRLLVVRDGTAGVAEQLEHRSVGTRLGEGLSERGVLSEAGMQRTLDAVRAHAVRADAWQASVGAIATSAMRRADNAAAFAARFEAAAGVPLRVLDGAEEAACSFAGATRDGAAGYRIAVLDVGGGSTECAAGYPGALEDAVSLETGAVRLGERFPQLLGGASHAEACAAAREARGFARSVLAPLRRLAPVAEVRAVAGTPLTLGAVLAKTHVDRVRGQTLGRDQLDGLIEQLLALDLAGRRALPGMIPQRADILPAGAIVVSEALRALDAGVALLESNDLLLGYLMRTGPGSPSA